MIILHASRCGLNRYGGGTCNCGAVTKAQDQIAIEALKTKDHSVQQPDPALQAAAQRLIECYRFTSNGPSQWLGDEERDAALHSLKGVVDALEWARKRALVPVKVDA